MIKHVLDREYYFDDITDIEEDVSWHIGETQVAKDSNGVFKGCFRVTVSYEENEDE